MRVLVTGGSGYIGSATVRELAQNGHNVIIYDDISTGHRKLSKGFELIEGDIADRSKILPVLKRADAIIHFAASAYVGESVTNPRKYFRNNVESALALMDSVLESDVRMFVFSSTCAVYGVPNPCLSASVVRRSPSIPTERLNCSSSVYFRLILFRMDLDLPLCVISMLLELIPFERSGDSQPGDASHSAGNSCGSGRDSAAHGVWRRS